MSVLSNNHVLFQCSYLFDDDPRDRLNPSDERWRIIETFLWGNSTRLENLENRKERKTLKAITNSTNNILQVKYQDGRIPLFEGHQTACNKVIVLGINIAR